MIKIIIFGELFKNKKLILSKSEMDKFMPTNLNGRKNQKIKSLGSFWRNTMLLEMLSIERIFEILFYQKKNTWPSISCTLLISDSIYPEPINCSFLFLSLKPCPHLRTFSIITCFKNKRNDSTHTRFKMALCR